MNASTYGVQDTAEFFGVSRGTIGNWINGRVAADLAKLRVWAVCFNVPLTWLVDGVWPDDWTPPLVDHDGMNELRLAAGLPTRKAPSEDGADVRPEGFEPPAYWSVASGVCERCDGSGMIYDHGEKVWAYCGRCNGNGWIPQTDAAFWSIVEGTDLYPTGVPSTGTH